MCRMAVIPPNIREEEGSRLRTAYQRLRLTKRITGADIAEQCGWQSASTFSRLLTGKVALTYESLMRLSKALGVPPETIAPRLIQDGQDGEKGKVARLLPVSLIRSVTRGSWGEPFLTELRLPLHTADQAAFALTFEPGVAPSGLESWVLVVEPSRKPTVHDAVIIRHGRGKYSYARVQSIQEDSSLSVAVDGRGLLMTTAGRCMLVSCLCRPADLRTFRACAEC